MNPMRVVTEPTHIRPASRWGGRGMSLTQWSARLREINRDYFQEFEGVREYSKDLTLHGFLKKKI